MIQKIKIIFKALEFIAALLVRPENRNYPKQSGNKVGGPRGGHRVAGRVVTTVPSHGELTDTREARYRRGCAVQVIYV